MGNKWAPGRAVPSDRSLWACFRASCLQLAWPSDLPETALPPGLGACACFGLGLKGGWGRKVETGRWIGPWHGVCLLWPLPLLLSKLVSKLDVLPGQFEVALLPPLQSCQHRSGQVPMQAWGTGEKGE